jgi:hypothetical protein
MEVVEVVFIATNHFLVVAPFLPTADGPRPWSGRSAPTHQRLKSQRSAVTAISTAMVHLMCCQMSDKVVVYGSAIDPGRSARTLKMYFTEPVTFGFFWFLNGRTVHVWSWTVLTSPLIVYSVNTIFAVFLSEAHPSVVDSLPQGSGRSVHR